MVNRLEQDGQDVWDNQDLYNKGSGQLDCLEQDGQDEWDEQDLYNKGSGLLHPEHHGHPMNPVQTMGGMK